MAEYKESRCAEMTYDHGRRPPARRSGGKPTCERGGGKCVCGARGGHSAGTGRAGGHDEAGLSSRRAWLVSSV